MAALSKILRSIEGNHIGFYCPGCEQMHVISVAEGDWAWNGDVDKPTFSPSILVTGGHYLNSNQQECWCTYNLKNPDNPSRFKCVRCHSYITDGKIQFLSDCSHHLVNQTVDLPMHSPDFQL